MTLTTKVLLGLGTGLAAGIALNAALPAASPAIAAWVEPVGTLWVNALRMTIIPLVVAGLIVGAASARDARSIGRLGGRALLIFFVLLTAAAAFTLVVGQILLSFLHVDPAAAAALRAGAAASATAAGADVQTAAQQGFPDLRQWFVALVPTNPIKAAADGAILPLIVFSVAFGLALSRIAAAERDLVRRFFSGLFDGALQLVRWILELAPIGVFALALPLATRLGLAAAGAVLYYVLIVVGISTLFILLLYPVATALGHVSLASFMKGAAPAQAVAFSSRSSLASLPAMIEGGEEHLGFPHTLTQFFLPLSASTFRLGGAIGISIGVLFAARLYGVDLAPVQLLTVGVTAVLLTFSIPGVPGGAILIMVPVLLAVGLPAEAVGILLGVDTIPDMFRTTANVTGTMAAATILAHGEAGAADDVALEPATGTPR